MPSIQLICQKSEFIKQFKDKFKKSFNIFYSESLKDGLRNIQKMDIDLMIVEIQPQRLKSHNWIESILRQKNTNIGEMCLIFLIDPELIQNPGFQKILAMKKNFHFFWLNSHSFQNTETLFIAFDLFLKNILGELNTLRTNFLLSNRLAMSPHLPASEQPPVSIPEYSGHQPVSFLHPLNSNAAFLDNLQKSIRNWPLVTLRGPEGLEQESLAKYIHAKNNSQNQFITVDLSEIPEYYHDSTFFGFTQKNLPGFKYVNSNLFDIVKKGTLYIKNIEHLKWEVQNDLFRVLQNMYFQRDDIKVNIKCRFIFSSSVDLEKYVEKNFMRQDLYSFLTVYTLNIPTIGQRKKDIPLLIDDYIQWFEKKYHKKIEISTEARLQLLKNHYPGQFDQFYNYLFRIFATASEKTITPEILPLFETDVFKATEYPKKNIISEKPDHVAPNSDKPNQKSNQTGFARFIKETQHISRQLIFSELDEIENLDYSLTEVERDYIKRVLAQNYNNIAETARILGITRKTLYDKLKKYKIKNPAKKTG